MAVLQLIIAPAAKEDLKAIHQYGLHRWGKVQSDHYLAALEDLFWLLIEQPLLGMKRPELLADIRSLPTQSHILFYRATATRVEIARVLHGRQDPQTFSNIR